MTSDVENLILVHLREMRSQIAAMDQRLDGFGQRLDQFDKRFDMLEGRFDELRTYVSFALGQGQMNFMKGNELEELCRVHSAKFAEIERRLSVVEQRTS